MSGAKGNKNQIDDKEVRTSILNKYGFVDHDDDTREHRPVAPKWVSLSLLSVLFPVSSIRL